MSIPILTPQAIDSLRRKARKLRKKTGKTQSECNYLVAKSIGFSSWKELVHEHKQELSMSNKTVRIFRNDFSACKPYQDRVDKLIDARAKSFGLRFSPESLRKSNIYRCVGFDNAYYDQIRSGLGFSNLSNSEMAQIIDEDYRNLRKLTVICEKEIAIENGYDDWSSLMKSNVKQATQYQYAMAQKIGAVSRYLNLDFPNDCPVVHVCLDDLGKDQLDVCSVAHAVPDFEEAGLIFDLGFEDYLREQDDDFDSDFSYGCIFRVLGLASIDLGSIDKELNKILEKLNTFHSRIHLIWINGKLDRNSLDYSSSSDCLHNLPPHIWGEKK